MKRLMAVLTILAFVGTWVVVPVASAMEPRRFGGTTNDPGRPSALEGSFITGGGQFQWLMIAAPRGCIDGDDTCPENQAHLWFYDAACNRQTDAFTPLTENDVKVYPLHLAQKTAVGNVLAAAISDFSGAQQPVLATNALIGEMFYIDVNRGIGRMEELARLGRGTARWDPYDGVNVILFAPPDDGVFFFDTLLVRCPVGGSVTAQGTVFGTAKTLAGDMIELLSQEEGGSITDGYFSTLSSASTSNLPNDSSTGDSSGRFAKAIAGVIYDTDEEGKESIDNIPCQCIGVKAPGSATFSPEVRLGALSTFAQSNESYWELESSNADGADDAWTASLNVRLVIGTLLNVNFFGRLHRASGKEALLP